MNEGKIVQLGTPREIYDHPADGFVAGFIGETNLLRGQVTFVGPSFVTLDVKDVGLVKVKKDRPITIGDTLLVTVRPEKIRITAENHVDTAGELTVLNAVVDELIYSGFQTKFFARINDSITTLLVFQPHIDYTQERAVINWKDRVYVWWGSTDAYIVEVNPS